jgi:hypothetical protein
MGRENFSFLWEINPYINFFPEKTEVFPAHLGLVPAKKLGQFSAQREPCGGVSAGGSLR